jgi:putative ABC transport system permease protein
MGTIDIDYGSLGIGLLLMLIPVYFLWHFKTGLLKPVLIGTVRMIIQLFLIGAYLRFLFEWNNPFINFLWVIIMVGVAADAYAVKTWNFDDSNLYRFFCNSGARRTLFSWFCIKVG